SSLPSSGSYDEAEQWARAGANVAHRCGQVWRRLSDDNAQLDDLETRLLSAGDVVDLTPPSSSASSLLLPATSKELHVPSTNEALLPQLAEAIASITVDSVAEKPPAWMTPDEARETRLKTLGKLAELARMSPTVIDLTAVAEARRKRRERRIERMKRRQAALRRLKSQQTHLAAMEQKLRAKTQHLVEVAARTAEVEVESVSAASATATSATGTSFASKPSEAISKPSEAIPKSSEAAAKVSEAAAKASEAPAKKTLPSDLPPPLVSDQPKKTPAFSFGAVPKTDSLKKADFAPPGFAKKPDTSKLKAADYAPPMPTKKPDASKLQAADFAPPGVPKKTDTSKLKASDFAPPGFGAPKKKEAPKLNAADFAPPGVAKKTDTSKLKATDFAPPGVAAKKPDASKLKAADFAPPGFAAKKPDASKLKAGDFAPPGVLPKKDTSKLKAADFAPPGFGKKDTSKLKAADFAPPGFGAPQKKKKEEEAKAKSEFSFTFGATEDASKKQEKAKPTFAGDDVDAVLGDAVCLLPSLMYPTCVSCFNVAGGAAARVFVLVGWFRQEWRRGQDGGQNCCWRTLFRLWFRWYIGLGHNDEIAGFCREWRSNVSFALCQ
ncbi:MAG: hypothetical protein MHM6MM_008821, partial [Cercozoa sp. M6MM]